MGPTDGVEEAGIAVGLQVPSVPELSGCWPVSELGSHPDESQLQTSAKEFAFL